MTTATDLEHRTYWSEGLPLEAWLEEPEGPRPRECRGTRPGELAAVLEAGAAR